MLARCYDESHPQYQDWGGRGIKVFHGWVDNYPAYAKYVNSLRKPSEKHNTLDRIDNDGDYEPGNLKWATRREQNINKRLYASNTSGLRGVHFNRSHKKWVVQFRVDGKVRAFGEFKTLSAAANKARSII